MEFKKPLKTPQSRFNHCHETIRNFLDDPKWISETSVLKEQIESVKLIDEHFRNSNENICVLQTDSDKSGIAVLSSYALNANHVLVIVPTLRTSKQIRNDFCDSNDKSFLVSKKVCNSIDFSNHFRPIFTSIVSSKNQLSDNEKNDLVIAKINNSNLDSNNVTIDDFGKKDFDLIIVNETQRYSNTSIMQNIKEYFKEARIIFLSSSPMNEFISRLNTVHINRDKSFY
jgi:superfamily II DNA or RNA helicase